MTCALAIARLLAIINFNDLKFGGDSMGYLSAAQFILEHARLPELTYQSKGFSIFLAGLIAISDDWERNYEILAALMDVIILIFISIIAIVFIKVRHVLCLLLIIIFFQPFTISYMRSLYPDHTCQFFTFIGAACVCCAFFMRRSIALLLLGAIFFGLAGVIRQDMIPVCLLIIVSASGLAFIKRAMDRRYLGQGVIITLMVAIAFPGSALLWQVRSSGEVGFAKPSHYSNPGVIFSGYSKWLRSWVVFGRAEHNRFAWSIGSESWPGFDIDQYPDRAFSGDDHRDRVSSLLSTWRDKDYSDELDEQFSLLAAENCAEFLGRCHIALPFARMAVLWINLDGADAFIAPLGIQRPLSTILVFLTLCLRLMTLLFAAYAVWQLVGGDFVKDIRLPLIAIGSSVVILRTIEIAVLGTSNSGISWGGLVEARYMSPVFPFLIGTAVLGLSLFLETMRSNVRERA